MPKLTLKFNNKVIKVYNYKKDKSISIGRKETSDIVIPNLTVSGSHAKIDYTDNGFLLTDLNSKNKTFVNGEELNAAILNDQDVIVIGKHSLVFNLSKDEHIQAEREIGMDQTMVLNSDIHKGMISKKISVEAQSPGIAMLAFVEGGEGKIEISRNTMSIGKDPANDIVIRGFFVGKTAAILKKTNQGVTLSYGGGFAKIFVNNKVVKHTILLEEFDVIMIGGAELQFFYK
ncbi:MAG: FHA domain-containing protein [Desulfobacteraceae bacterium]|jgi:pSer/pThr/pTyr-binding forkhead associated (FHA) protein